MRICFIGDIVAYPGLNAVKNVLPSFLTSNQVDFCIINGENSAGGHGISSKIANDLFSVGADVITLGNHAFSNREFISQADKMKKVVRPANYSPKWPGNDYSIVDKNGKKFAVFNLLGQLGMGYIPDNPYVVAEQLVNDIKSSYNPDFIILDFHAEGTSEKQAMGYMLDGKVSLVVGTHTHVQTADNKVLPNGTGYITDVGMCGVEHSVIGMDIETSIMRVANKMYAQYKPATGDAFVNGILADFDDNGKCISVRRFCEYG